MMATEPATMLEPAPPVENSVLLPRELHDPSRHGFKIESIHANAVGVFGVNDQRFAAVSLGLHSARSSSQRYETPLDISTTLTPKAARQIAVLLLRAAQEAEDSLH